MTSQYFFEKIWFWRSLSLVYLGCGGSYRLEVGLVKGLRWINSWKDHNKDPKLGANTI
jgi:hypothetical protein